MLFPNRNGPTLNQATCSRRRAIPLAASTPTLALSHVDITPIVERLNEPRPVAPDRRHAGLLLPAYVDAVRLLDSSRAVVCQHV